MENYYDSFDCEVCCEEFFAYECENDDAEVIVLTKVA